MKEYKKELESKVFIAFNDCDPFRHLNNARYVDYFFNAREQQLNEFYNFSLADWGAKGMGWFVTQNQVAYLKPANYAETVIIISRILLVTDFDMLLEMVMWNEKKTRVKAILWSRLLHVDLTGGKRLQHNKELMDLFDAIVYNEENIELKNFETRTEQIRTGEKGRKET